MENTNYMTIKCSMKEFYVITLSYMFLTVLGNNGVVLLFKKGIPL